MQEEKEVEAPSLDAPSERVEEVGRLTYNYGNS
jgi:hypothetical protein